MTPIDTAPSDWADCAKCGATRFFPSGRCMQGCDGFVKQSPKICTDTTGSGWEPVAPELSRIEVPGGWLYWSADTHASGSTTSALCFVPFPPAQHAAARVGSWLQGRDAVVKLAEEQVAQHTRHMRAHKPGTEDYERHLAWAKKAQSIADAGMALTPPEPKL